MKNVMHSIVALFVMSVSIASVQAAPIELLCKNFRFFMPVGGNLGYNGYDIQMQQTVLTTPTGESKLTYTPISTLVEQQFQAVTVAAGAKGENLLAGQCGLASGVISGINLDVRRGLPTLQFANFRNMTIISGGQYAGSTVARGSVLLPQCPSGVWVFTAHPQNVNQYFVSGDASVRCL